MVKGSWPLSRERQTQKCTRSVSRSDLLPQPRGSGRHRQLRTNLHWILRETTGRRNHQRRAGHLSLLLKRLGHRVKHKMRRMRKSRNRRGSDSCGGSSYGRRKRRGSESGPYSRVWLGARGLNALCKWVRECIRLRRTCQRRQLRQVRREVRWAAKSIELKLLLVREPCKRHARGDSARSSRTWWSGCCSYRHKCCQQAPGSSQPWMRMLHRRWWGQRETQNLYSHWCCSRSTPMVPSAACQQPRHPLQLPYASVVSAAVRATSFAFAASLSLSLVLTVLLPLPVCALRLPLRGRSWSRSRIRSCCGLSCSLLLLLLLLPA